MPKITDKTKGFGLLEVLVAMLIFTGVIIASVSVLFRTARETINNEIADRAKNIGIQTLETVKNSKNVSQIICDKSSVRYGGGYAWTRINLVNPGLTDQNHCMILKSQVVSSKIDSCSLTSAYFVQLEIPEDAKDYQDLYCIQIIFEEIEGQNFQSTVYDKVTVVVVHQNISKNNLVTEYYGFIPKN